MVQIPRLARFVAPLFSLTAFALLLVTVLTPSVVLKDRSSLLSISSQGAKSSLLRARDASAVHLGRQGGFQRVAKPLIAERAPASSDTGRFELSIGMLGSCLQTQGGARRCSSPSFTPIFVETYRQAGLSSTAQASLPDQLPLIPTITFLGLLLFAFAAVTSLLAPIPLHTKAVARLQPLQKRLVKLGLILACVGTLAGIVASIVLRIQFEKATEKPPAGIDVSLGASFNQLWAGWCLALVTLLLSAIGLKTS